METIHKIDEKGRKSGCPLGHCCDECNLYRPLYRYNQANVVVAAVYDCTWNNMTRMQSEAGSNMLGVQAAIEDFRNLADEAVGEALEGRDRPRLIKNG